jgi:hypothetical protein
MEDLFLAVFRRHAEKALASLADIASSSQPLQALWDLSIDPEDSRLIMEFTALANHQKAIRSEIARYGERYRTVQIDVLSRIFEQYGLTRELYSPRSVAMVLTALARHLVVEESMGMRGGHAEARVLVQQFIRRLEGSRKPAKASRGPRGEGK